MDDYEKEGKKWRTLRQLFSSQSSSFSEPLVATLVHQILKALELLHKELKVAHLEVDLDHIVCDQIKLDYSGSRFKLIGFNNAQVLPGSKKDQHLLDKKTNAFSSPEIH